MVRPLFSAFAFLLLTTTGCAQAFGRFGYTKSAAVPGFKVDQGGFSSADPLADKIRFAKPSAIWAPIITSAVEQDVLLGEGKGAPSKAMFDLLGLGFSLYFASGIDLRVGSLGAPYLSWEQGSVSNGVATPAVTWIVVSFQDRQPAIVLGFPTGRPSLAVSGTAGAWSITTSGKFQGWVRIALPQGLDAPLANTAGALGRLAKTAAANSALWTSMPPKLLKTDLASDLRSVTADWRFDRPGAVVPPAAMLATLGGYGLGISTATRRLPGWTEAGPTDVLIGTSLTVRFPVRRVPTGRALALGGRLSQAPAAVAPLDVAAVANLALLNLIAERDPLARKAAEKATGDYISQANYTIEPWTRQQLPFDVDGRGMDLAAAHAFLMQAVTSASRATSESNSLLTSVTWRQDWLTWQASGVGEQVAQRTGALAALAGALCPEPERRLSAGMFQAGLSARRGLNIWRRRQGLADSAPKLIEPLFGVRRGLFGLLGDQADGIDFAKALLSPLRVFSDRAVSLTKHGADYELQTLSPDAKLYVLTLATAYPVEAAASLNVAYLKVAAALGFTELHYIPTAPGLATFKLVIPAYGQPPPQAAPVGTYSEQER